jgi:hypothetical protein
VVSDYWVAHGECFLLICRLFFIEQFLDRQVLLVLRWSFCRHRVRSDRSIVSFISKRYLSNSYVLPSNNCTISFRSDRAYRSDQAYRSDRSGIKKIEHTNDPLAPRLGLHASPAPWRYCATAQTLSMVWRVGPLFCPRAPRDCLPVNGTDRS